MLCDICQQPATEQCPVCWTPLCADHGGPVCCHCAAAARNSTGGPSAPTSTAIYTTERNSRRVWARSYLPCTMRPGMPTIYLEDPGPPSCHECQGLARQLCRHCQQLFCPEHAGGPELCRQCARSSLIGLVILATITLSMTTLVFLGR